MTRAKGEEFDGLRRLVSASMDLRSPVKLNVNIESLDRIIRELDADGVRMFARQSMCAHRWQTIRVMTPYRHEGQRFCNYVQRCAACGSVRVYGVRCDE